MPLGTPTYEDYPTPSKPKRRVSGTSPRPKSTPIPNNPYVPGGIPTPAPTQPPPSHPSSGGPVSVSARPITDQERQNVLSHPPLYRGPMSNGPVTSISARPITDQERLNVLATTPEYQIEQDQLQRQSFMDSLINQFDAWSASQQDALQSKYDLGLANMSALYGLNRGILEQGLGTDLGLLDERRYRDVDLAREALAGKQGDLAAYMDILAQREGIRRDMFTTDRDYYNALNQLLGRERGLAYNRYQSNDQYLMGQGQDNLKQYGFAARDYRNDIAGARLQRDTSRRAATSDAAARGSFGSSGFRDNISDILSQYGLNSEAAQLALDRANQQIQERDKSITQERANLGFGYEGQVIGFDRDAAGLTRSAAQNYNQYRDDLQGFRKQRVDLNAQGRELESTGKALDSLAREYGIKRTDIENQFNNAVTRLGLDREQTRQQLEEMLNSGNAEVVARGLEFMNMMMVYQDGSVPNIATPSSHVPGAPYL